MTVSTNTVSAGAACRNGTYESMLTLGHSWFGLRSWSETARQGSRRGAGLVRTFSPLSHASKILNQSVLSATRLFSSSPQFCLSCI